MSRLKLVKNAQLTRLTNDLAKKYFHKPIDFNVYYNLRLKTCGGYFRFNRATNHYFITINPKILPQSGKKALVGDIKHELCHWYLYLKGYKGIHGARFKRLLHRVGGLAYSPVKYSNGHTFYLYQCVSCGNVFIRNRKMNPKDYLCAKKVKTFWGKGKCGGHLVSLGTISEAQLKHKPNKVTRAEYNFKRKKNFEKHYVTVTAHLLGYENPRVREASELNVVMGSRMIKHLMHVIPKLSAHARQQLLKLFKKEGYDKPKHYLKLVKNSHFTEKFVTYKKPYALKQIKKSTLPLLYVKYDGDFGWIVNGIADYEIMDTLHDFMTINFTNGTKLFKDMIKFIKKHNCKKSVQQKKQLA